MVFVVVVFVVLLVVVLSLLVPHLDIDGPVNSLEVFHDLDVALKFFEHHDEGLLNEVLTYILVKDRLSLL